MNTKNLLAKAAAVFASLLCAASVFACAVSAAAVASLSGPQTVCPRETVTLSLKIDGMPVSGVTAELSYSDNLEFDSFSNVPLDWEAALGNDKKTVVAYNNGDNNPIESGKTVFSINFKVKADAVIGQKAAASISGTASDGKNETNFSAQYSAEITECVHKSFVWVVVSEPSGENTGTMAKKCLICETLFDEREFSVLYGDANNDGIIDLDDAIAAARVSVGTATDATVDKEKADVNGDGTVDIKDALLIARFVSGTIDEFSVEND